VADDALTLLYDEECGFCTWLAATLARRRGLDSVGIGSVTGARLLRDLPLERRYDSVHVVDAQGRRRSGAAALPTLLHALPRLAWASRVVEGFPQPFAWGYELVSRHRQVLSRVLRLESCGAD
jgi:predicted DCC family thiol-disulfide oxidoreductase YuxK